MDGITPLERAARALHASRMKRQHPKPEAYPWEDLSPKEQQLRMLDARIVIEAIREPSEAMVSLAYGECHHPADVPSHIWQSMLDALLAEAATSPPPAA